MCMISHSTSRGNEAKAQVKLGELSSKKNFTLIYVTVILYIYEI